MVRIVFDEPETPEFDSSAPSVVMTDAAAERIAQILEEENTPDLYLRVRVDGGGCNGYSYNFSFDKERKEDDIAIENQGVTVLIDPLSHSFLKGSTLDFVETLEVSQLVIKNPNATASCGCGNSFSL